MNILERKPKGVDIGVLCVQWLVLGHLQRTAKSNVAVLLNRGQWNVTRAASRLAAVRWDGAPLARSM